MANCTYRFTDADGQERTIEGLAAFKAYLVDGGLRHLLPSFAAPGAPAFSARQDDSKITNPVDPNATPQEKVRIGKDYGTTTQS